MGQGGMGLEEPQSGDLEREWQGLVRGQMWALWGEHLELVASEWWDLEEVTWEKRQSFQLCSLSFLINLFKSSFVISWLPFKINLFLAI